MQDLQDVQKVPFTLDELDADGNPATGPGDTVAYVSDDETKATVVVDAPPAAGHFSSGFIVGGKTLGVATVTAAITRADGSAGPGSTVQVNITGGPVAGVGFNLGVPVAQ